MKLARAAVVVRLLCFVFGVGAFCLAWRMTVLGASGAEDIPPPFILVAGLSGVVLLFVGISGRYPWREPIR